jgi:quinoprotein glucose dehydrogenase
MNRKIVRAVAVLPALATLLLIRAHGPAVFAGDAKHSAPYTQWREYGGTLDDAQYSALKQINRSNVMQLQRVWFYPAGNNGFRYGSNPIVIDGIIYVIGVDNGVAALDAATGKQIWLHENEKPQNISNRGVDYWESKDRSDRRILFSINNQLTALDARTGKTIDGFGDHGFVDLRAGLGRDPSSIRQIRSGTPGKVFEDLLILGSATGEEYESPPGDLRAFNVVTGKLAWTFHTVPHPGDIGYETWPKEAWKYIGGTNTWGEISIDEKRGIAYFPTGSPTYDFYGADRHGADLYSDCIIALDVRTGKYLWHFQTTHHDLWDYDLESGPKLLTVHHNGKEVDVLADAGKNGFVWVLDRETGKPIWPVEERPVPKSDMTGEESWPTQPFPTVIPPFARQIFNTADVDPYITDPKEREEIRQQVLAARNGGLYTPPSTSNTVETPGNNGGSNWGSTAVDPPTGTFYVLSKDAPAMLKLEQKRPKFEMNGSPETRGQVIYLQNCAICHTATMQGQPPGIPSLVGIVDRVGADRVRSTVRNGLSPMPAFPDLSKADLERLLAYLSHPGDAHVPADILTRLTTPQPPNQKSDSSKVRYWTGYGYMNSSDGLPAIGPPWSTLTAYDLNTGKIKWQIPYGGVSKLEAQGISNTGSYWPRGGVAITAGGLIFGGSKSDSTFRAYDKDTGKVLWETKLPAGPEGIPTVYEIAGREYVVISARPDSDKIVAAGGAAPQEAAGGAGTNQPQQTQGYYAFALP